MTSSYWFSLLNQFFQRSCHQPFGAVAAVVGHQSKLFADGFKRILQYDQILGAKPDHAVYNGTLVLQLRRHWKRDGAAYAAANNANFTQSFGVRRLTKRADAILQTVALHEGNSVLWFPRRRFERSA